VVELAGFGGGKSADFCPDCIQYCYKFLNQRRWAEMWTPKFFKMIKESAKTPEHRLAWAIAIVADTLQIAALPLFAEGGISPLDTALDFVVAAALTKLLGWHWAFLPTFTAELIPGLDLVPTWTAAVFYVTFRQISTNEPDKIGHRTVQEDGSEVLPPGPAPIPR
jgi:hypothetical protein